MSTMQRHWEYFIVFFVIHNYQHYFGCSPYFVLLILEFGGGGGGVAAAVVALSNSIV